MKKTLEEPISFCLSEGGGKYVSGICPEKVGFRNRILKSSRRNLILKVMLDLM